MNLQKKTPGPLSKKNLFLMEDLSEVELHAMMKDFEKSAEEMGIPLTKLDVDDDNDG